MPDVHVDVGQGVAGVGVNHLDVHVERYTLLGLDNVLADELTGDICIYQYRSERGAVENTNSTVPG